MNNLIKATKNKISTFEIVNGLTLDLISFFYKATGLPRYSTNKKIVLCYHSVGNNGWRYSTKVKDFKNHWKFLKKNYHIISLRNLLKENQPGLSISFDDGYLDVYENALPILGSYPAAMFVLGDYKKANRKELDNNLEIIGYSKLKKLNKKGWEIGSHTMTHSNLGQLSGEQLVQEISGSKKVLEENLGIKIKYFAYPKGFYSKEIVDLVKKAGYETAFTVDAKVVELNNMMLVNRIPVEGRLTVQQLEALLSPLGITIFRFYIRILQLKERITTGLIKYFFGLSGHFWVSNKKEIRL